MEFVKSSRGGDILIHRGYPFWRHSTFADNTTVWRCKMRKRHNCRAYVLSKNDQVTNDSHALHVHTLTTTYGTLEIPSVETSGSQMTNYLSQSNFLMQKKNPATSVSSKEMPISGVINLADGSITPYEEWMRQSEESNQQYVKKSQQKTNDIRFNVL